MPIKNIPIHSLSDINKTGIEIKRMYDINEVEKDLLGVHRDDHYLFFFQQSGRGEMMIDFNEVKSAGEQLFFIRPGQVHQVLGVFDCKGWFLAVDPTYINEVYRTIFEELTIAQQLITPNNEIAKKIDRSLSLLEETCNNGVDLKFQGQVIRSLIDTTIGLYASAFFNHIEQHEHLLRPAIITRQFKSLLHKNYTEIKSPSAYANLLNISSTYLNETIKQTTGFSVSYLIHQEIVMEAKRLLYYTSSSVKEIAHSLGFSDHAYFSRLFNKVVGHSPVQFRKHYRE